MALQQKNINSSINTTGVAKVPEQTPPIKRINIHNQQILRKENLQLTNKKVKNQQNQNPTFKSKVVPW